MFLFFEMVGADVEWVVQEKVHGSNFSVYYDPAGSSGGSGLLS